MAVAPTMTNAINPSFSHSSGVRSSHRIPTSDVFCLVRLTVAPCYSHSFRLSFLRRRSLIFGLGTYNHGTPEVSKDNPVQNISTVGANLYRLAGFKLTLHRGKPARRS
jgi:hypothetical protein